MEEGRRPMPLEAGHAPRCLHPTQSRCGDSRHPRRSYPTKEVGWQPPAQVERGGGVGSIGGGEERDQVERGRRGIKWRESGWA